MKVALYDDSFMGVFDDLVNFVSSFQKFYNSVYIIAPKCLHFKIVLPCTHALPYGYGNDLSEVRLSSGSLYSLMHLAVLVFPECNTLLY
jgi:hypothetical protein